MLCLVRKYVIFISDELFEVWMKEDVARCNICISERMLREIRVCRDVTLCCWVGGGRTFCCGCVCRVKRSSRKTGICSPSDTASHSQPWPVWKCHIVCQENRFLPKFELMQSKLWAMSSEWYSTFTQFMSLPGHRLSGLIFVRFRLPHHILSNSLPSSHVALYSLSWLAASLNNLQIKETEVTTTTAECSLVCNVSPVLVRKCPYFTVQVVWPASYILMHFFLQSA
jgi:hypothetical protein